MSKISFAIAVACLGSIIAFAKDGFVQAQIYREKENFFAKATDKNGFLREYNIVNAQKFIFACLKNEGRWIELKGQFVDKGTRTGTLSISEIGEEIFDPLKH